MTSRAYLAAPAVLLFTLAGCAGGGGGTADGSAGGPADGAGGGAPGSAATECLARTWALDIPDAAAQLGDFMRTNGGIEVSQSEGSGVQLMTFGADGSAASDNDVTYTVTVVDGELTLTVVQTHSGEASGGWTWADEGAGTITFDTWDNGSYTIQTQTIVNGTASPNQTTTPTASLSEGSVMTVDCSGDSLTTTITASPFTQHWTARD